MSRNILQPSKSIVVDISSGDDDLNKKPCLIMNNQSTGALIACQLEGDASSRLMYFAAGEIKNLKVIKVVKVGTTSTNILAFYDSH